MELDQFNKLREFIRDGETTEIPSLEGSFGATDINFRQGGCDEFWTIYICYDPTDEIAGVKVDKYTVWACRTDVVGKPFLGESPLRILGRGLPLREASKLVNGSTLLK